MVTWSIVDDVGEVLVVSDLGMFGREIGCLEKKVMALDRLRVRTNIILLLNALISRGV